MSELLYANAGKRIVDFQEPGYVCVVFVCLMRSVKYNRFLSRACAEKGKVLRLERVEV